MKKNANEVRLLWSRDSIDCFLLPMFDLSEVKNYVWFDANKACLSIDSIRVEYQ